MAEGRGEGLVGGVEGEQGVCVHYGETLEGAVSARAPGIRDRGPRVRCSVSVQVQLHALPYTRGASSVIERYASDRAGTRAIQRETNRRARRGIHWGTNWRFWPGAVGFFLFRSVDIYFSVCLRNEGIRERRSKTATDPHVHLDSYFLCARSVLVHQTQFTKTLVTRLRRSAIDRGSVDVLRLRGSSVRLAVHRITLRPASMVHRPRG